MNTIILAHDKQLNYFTRFLSKLHRHAQTRGMLFMCFFNFNGITPDNILKHFNRPIHLSTWIRDLAILRVLITALADKRPRLVKGGIFHELVP